MSIIDQLHGIKAFREKKSEAEMVKSRLSLARARAEESRRRQALEAQQAHARDEELRLYRDLCARLVRPRDITRVQEDVIALQAVTREHQQQLVGAEKAHLQARDMFDDAFRHYRHATNAREKFEELMRREARQLLRETERREESELEEMSGNLRDRLDFEGQDHG